MIDDLHSPLYFFAIAVTVFGVVLTLFYSFHNFKSGLQQKMLTVVFLSILYFYFVQFLIVFNFIEKYPHFFRTGALSSLIFSPLMYLIIRGYIQQKKVKFKDIVHLIPALLYLINLVPFFLKTSVEKKEYIFKIVEQGTYFVYDEGVFFSDKQIFVLRVFQVLVYICLIIIILFKNWTVIKEKNTLKKLSILFVTFLTINFLIAVFWSVSKTNIDTILLALMVNSLLFFVYFLLNPELILKPNRDFILTDENESSIAVNNVPMLLNPTIVISNSIPVEIKNQTATNSRELLRIAQIEQYLAKEKPYLNQDFSLKKIEAHLDISGKLISKSIKGKYKSNFNSYINSLRIGYTLQKLNDDIKWRSFTIEQLAGAVGFSSVNLFYNYFKERTGLTPREYIENLVLNNDKPNQTQL